MVVWLVRKPLVLKVTIVEFQVLFTGLSMSKVQDHPPPKSFFVNYLGRINA